MDQTTLIGTSGAFLILLAFALNQVNKWKNDYLIYDLVNFIGAILLVIYAYILSSYPFLILNSIWGIFSLKDIITDLKRNAARKTGSHFFNKWLK